MPMDWQELGRGAGEVNVVRVLRLLPSEQRKNFFRSFHVQQLYVVSTSFNLSRDSALFID